MIGADGHRKAVASFARMAFLKRFPEACGVAYVAKLVLNLPTSSLSRHGHFGGACAMLFLPKIVRHIV